MPWQYPISSTIVTARSNLDSNGARFDGPGFNCLYLERFLTVDAILSVLQTSLSINAASSLTTPATHS